MDIPELTTQSQPISKHEYKGKAPAPKKRGKKDQKTKLRSSLNDNKGHTCVKGHPTAIHMALTM
jgi:hypothetical protein